MQDSQRTARFVTVPLLEYEDLIRTKIEYTALRKALVDGGVDSENLDLLIGDALYSLAPDASPADTTTNPPTPPNEHRTDTSEHSSSQRSYAMPPPAFSSSLRMKRPIYGDNGLREASNQRHESSHPTKPHQAQPPPKPPDPPKPPNPSNLPCPPTVLHTVEELDRTHGPGPDEQDEEDQARQLARQQARYDDRSLVFRGLSSTTELLDITSAIRGGAILSVHLKPRDRTAHVSFVDSTAAHEFCVWAKRNDIYIKDKRVIVEWDEKQLYIPKYLARQIKVNGASRNLLILFATPEMTADAIREDLEHIHHLRVVNIRTEGHHVVICTNGISNAITAKSCMMSRLRYMSTRIEYYPDECAEAPLPPIRKTYDRKSLPAKDAGISHKNRFQVLGDHSEDL